VVEISALKMEKGLALQDILTDVFSFIQQIEFPRATRIHLLTRLAEIEYVFDRYCTTYTLLQG
jgi:replication factor C subunit 3/5